MKKSFLITLIILLLIISGVIGWYFFAKKKTEVKTKVEKASEEIVIGYNADQSKGPTKAFGIWGRQGFEIAVDEINNRGGILGRKIRPVILDDQANPEISKQNMEKLIFEEKALAVIGPGNSTCALNWLELAQDNETIVITPIATATEITNRYSDRPRNFIFGIRTLDRDQVRLFIAWAIRKTNNGEIAVIYESTDYGKKGLNDVNEVLNSWGKIPCYTKAIERGQTLESLVSAIKEAKSAKADAIIFYTLSDLTAQLLKATEEVKDYNPVLIGTAANAGGLWDLAGPLASKLIFTAPVNADYNEKTKILNQKIIEKFGQPPFILSSAAAAYDAVYLIKAAIEKVGKIDKVAVRDALETLDKFEGTMRTFEKPFTKKNHDLLTPLDSFLSYWVNGKIEMIGEDISDLEIR